LAKGFHSNLLPKSNIARKSVSLHTAMQTSPCATKLLSKLETEESPAQLQEERCPVAFDIPFRSPSLAGWHVASLAKERLAKYGGRKSPEAYQKLEEARRQKCQKAEDRLMERKEKARRHNEKVAKRVHDVQQTRMEQASTKKWQMAAHDFQVSQNAHARLNERKQKACQHNEMVAGRVWVVHQEWEKRQESLNARWEQKKGSRVKGELFSCVDRNASVVFSTPEAVATHLVGGGLPVVTSVCVYDTKGSRSQAGTNTASLTVLLEDTAIHPTGNGCSSLCALPMNVLNDFMRYFHSLTRRKRHVLAPQRLVLTSKDQHGSMKIKKIMKIKKSPMTVLQDTSGLGEVNPFRFKPSVGTWLRPVVIVEVEEPKAPITLVQAFEQ
jgi:hypothetical protein